MSQRIKGQETSLIFTSSEVGLETSLSDIQSHTMELQMDILSEGYLGETTERKDDIFKGFHGKIEAHVEKAEYFRFLTRIVDRARRRTPADGQFNCATTLAYPSGETIRVLFQDIYFGSPNVDIGSREDYVKVSFEYECSNYKVIG